MPRNRSLSFISRSYLASLHERERGDERKLVRIVGRAVGVEDIVLRIGPTCASQSQAAARVIISFIDLSPPFRAALLREQYITRCSICASLVSLGTVRRCSPRPRKGMAPASAWYGGGESPGSRPERGERLTLGTQKGRQTPQNGQSDSYEHPKLGSMLPIVEVGVKSAVSCKMGSAGTLWSTQHSNWLSNGRRNHFRLPAALLPGSFQQVDGADRLAMRQQSPQVDWAGLQIGVCVRKTGPLPWNF